MRLYFGSVIILLVLTACKSVPTPYQVLIVEDKSAVVSLNADSNAVAMDVEKDKPLLDTNGILGKRNIYFKFNSYYVQAAFEAMLAAHAKYLRENPETKIVLQGNTDTLGSHEFNLALGQRRAVAVKNKLNLLGVKDVQIETVSFGEERADLECTVELCYKDNRHVDIVY